MTPNFGYCISEYLSNRYDIVIEEKLCCLLGSSIDLQLTRRENTFEPLRNKDLTDLTQCYIESTNPLALENFCTCINSVLRFDHNNDFNDLKWIISDYHNLGKVKTLILLSSNVLNTKGDHMHHPVYAIAHPVNPEPAEYSNSTLKTSEISIQFAKNVSVTLTGEQLEKLWQRPGNEIFNANRYVIIPPIYNNFEKSLPDLICNALTRQYFHLMNKGDFVGPRLIRSLSNHLDSDQSEKNRRCHRELLLYSISKNRSFDLDMNRRYVADGYQYLQKQNLISGTGLATSLVQSGEKWHNAYCELESHDVMSVYQLKNIYSEIYANEMKIMEQLKEIIM
jgi:hypothetical protein